jgi:molybdopterin-guanine dinucleotide biosynthesis protein
MEWVKAPEAMRKLILWMYGPAGSGKTAIAQSIAEECKERGLLAASVFFSRSAPGRNDTDTMRVVATLAYQISRFLPQVENELFCAIERDPTIFSRNLATQMQVLIIEPLKALPASLRKPIFVILDGLDEIGPDTTLLDAIEKVATELQHVSVIFLISSRPEYQIREAFGGPILGSFMRPLELNDRYNPDTDIKLYLDSTFRQIHDKYLRLGICLPSSWPLPSNVDRLVSKASGQFIFAATAMKFVDSVRHDPAQRLNIILGLSEAGNETPFAPLDALYHHILASVTDIAQVLAVLALLILTPKRDDDFTPPVSVLTVGVIGGLLGIEVRRALIDMHALISVPPPADNSTIVRIHHNSLCDFLTDRSRSREYYIDKTQGHIALSRRWVKALGNRHVSANLAAFSTCVRSFIFHCKNSPVTGEIADDLAHLNLEVLLEDIYTDFGCAILRTPWKEFFDCVKRQVGLTDT